MVSILPGCICLPRFLWCPFLEARWTLGAFWYGGTRKKSPVLGPELSTTGLVDWALYSTGYCKIIQQLVPKRTSGDVRLSLSQLLFASPDTNNCIKHYYFLLLVHYSFFFSSGTENLHEDNLNHHLFSALHDVLSHFSICPPGLPHFTLNNLWT